MNKIDTYIESLIFASEKPISIPEIQQSLYVSLSKRFTSDELDESLDRLMLKFTDPEFSFTIQKVNQAFQFSTKAEYHHIIAAHLKEQNRRKLSKAALETLSIIAYQQPISRIDIEQIRGVNCEYTLHKLLEKELIEISGRLDAPGRPLIYITSPKFMHYFGLNSIKDLPKLSDLNDGQNQIGDTALIESNEQFKSKT